MTSQILVNIGSGNDVAPNWCQAFIRNNGDMLSTGLLGTNCREILNKMHQSISKKMNLKLRQQNLTQVSLCVRLTVFFCLELYLPEPYIDRFYP